MIKTVIKPQKNNYLIDIPKDYIGKELEILMYSKEELLNNKVDEKKSMKDFVGILSDKTANLMQQEVVKSRNSWDERLKKQF